MTRRNKIKRKGTYLDPDFEEVNNALVEQHTKLNKKGKRNVAIALPDNVKKGTNAWTYGGGGGATTHESHVHEGKKVIYENSGKQLFAGNGRGVDEASGEWDLIIDLANNLPYVNPFGCVKERSAKRFDVLRKYCWGPKQVKSEVLSLDWPDMGVLPATYDFWQALWNMLPAKTVMMCVGGHGRTGTCLAALMIAAGETYYFAVNHVRVTHCGKAIETLAQEKYLHALYMERLRRQIKHAKGSKEKAEFEAALTYAEQFVPHQQSSYGEKVQPKPAATSPVATKNVSNENLAQDRLKLIGGKLYEQVCVDPLCVKANCTEAEHQGWVDYDIPDEVGIPTV